MVTPYSAGWFGWPNWTTINGNIASERSVAIASFAASLSRQRRFDSKRRRRHQAGCTAFSSRAADGRIDCRRQFHGSGFNKTDRAAFHHWTTMAVEKSGIMGELLHAAQKASSFSPRLAKQFSVGRNGDCFYGHTLTRFTIRAICIHVSGKTLIVAVLSSDGCRSAARWCSYLTLAPPQQKQLDSSPIGKRMIERFSAAKNRQRKVRRHSKHELYRKAHWNEREASDARGPLTHQCKFFRCRSCTYL